MSKKKKQNKKIKGPKYQRYLGNIREDYLIKEIVQSIGTKICFTNEPISAINLIQSNVYHNDSIGDYGVIMSHKLLSNDFLSSIKYKETKFEKRYNPSQENEVLLVKNWDPRKRNTRLDEMLNGIKVSDEEILIDDYDLFPYREPYKNCIEKMLLENDFSFVYIGGGYKNIINCYANHVKLYNFPSSSIKNISIDNPKMLK